MVQVPTIGTVRAVTTYHYTSTFQLEAIYQSWTHCDIVNCVTDSFVGCLLGWLIHSLHSISQSDKTASPKLSITVPYCSSGTPGYKSSRTHQCTTSTARRAFLCTCEFWNVGLKSYKKSPTLAHFGQRKAFSRGKSRKEGWT